MKKYITLIVCMCMCMVPVALTSVKADSNTEKQEGTNVGEASTPTLTPGSGESDQYKEIVVDTDEDLSVQLVVASLNNPSVSSVLIKAKTLTKLPNEIIAAVLKTGKEVIVKVECNKTDWYITAQNAKGIKGDLNLAVSLASQYENEIKEITKADDLAFITFENQYEIPKTKMLSSDYVQYPVTVALDYRLFDTEQELYVYSYDALTREIKLAGNAVMMMKPPALGVNLELLHDVNTIFVSAQKGLEISKPDVDKPILPSFPNEDVKPGETSNKVINSDKIITKDIETALKDPITSTVTVNITNPDTVTVELLNTIKNTGKAITFNVLGVDNKVNYSWTFNGKDMKNIEMSAISLDIKYESNKQKEIEKIKKQENAFYLQFAHHGQLPVPATVKVNVVSQYKDGDIITLYYFNEEKGVVEKVTSNIKVEAGYATIVIDHCSTYFFTKENVDNTSKVAMAPKTGDNTQLLGCVLANISAVICFSFWLKKKKVEEI